MKIGVFTEHGADHIGGGATFPSEILKGLRAHDNRHEFVSITLSGPNAPEEGRLSLTGKKSQNNKWRRLSDSFRSRIPFGYRGRNSLSAAINDLSSKYGLEAMYYPTPQYIPSILPAVITLWDLAHRIYPFFPEVNYEGWTWESRESFYKNSLPRAATVLTGTETGRKQAIHHFGLNSERVSVIPFPTPSFVYDVEGLSRPQCASKISKPFIFYPAQFWPHKNHIVLLKALSQLSREKIDIDLVLCGSDQGNLNYVRGCVKAMELSNKVHIVGFVPRQDLVWLYRNSIAMVFPSYFGPDNLPPLEAMALGTPVIAADIAGVRDQLGDAALYFNPANPNDLARAIKRLIESPRLHRTQRTRGHKLSRDRSIKKYINRLNEVFDTLSAMRECWSNAGYSHVQAEKT